MHYLPIRTTFNNKYRICSSVSTSVNRNRSYILHMFFCYMGLSCSRIGAVTLN